MFPWLNQNLREAATEGGEGGGGTAVVTETAEQKELRTIREENAALKKNLTESQESERAWSERALRAGQKPEAVEPPEKKSATAEDLETGEQLLDDISKDGLKALKKRGYVTLSDVQKLVNESIERAVGENRSEGQFQNVMEDEFPDMAADLKRVNAGKKPETELFILSAEIYNDAIALDPDLKGSKSALIMATRQAAAQLQLDGKRKVDDKATREASRRERIDRQKPDRASSGSDVDETPGLNAKQKQMAADLGISEDKFMKQQARIKGERGK